MSAGHLHLLQFLKAARTDTLAAVAALPTNTEVAKARFGVPFVVAQQFSAAQQVLVSDADSYRKPWMVRQVIEDGLGENLFTTDGKAWLARRQPCAPAFGVQRVEALAEIMVETIDQTTRTWRAGDIDIQVAMSDLAVTIALRALLGTSDETADLAATARNDFEEILDWITFRFNRPVSAPALIPTSRNRRLKAAQTSLRAAIGQLITRRRQHDDGSVDVLSQLVRAQRDGKHGFTDKAILDECVGFMFAGHETTASTLTWALYELALRPGLQKTIALEGSRLASDSGALLGRVQAMSETHSVVEETLRMYPAGISIVRSAKRTTEISGQKVRRGTMVMIPVYAIQRSASVWDRPNEFDPTRHNDGNGDGFLPFGLGPRRCLGARFARTELNIAIAMICDRWQLAYEQATPPTPVAAPSLRADGELRLTISKR